MRVRFSWSMTRLYCACRAETDVHEIASSVPDAPPNEAMTSPPEARRVLMAPFQPASVMAVSTYVYVYRHFHHCV